VPVIFVGAAGKRALAPVLAGRFTKPFEPPRTRLPALRHMLSGPPARRCKLAGFVPHLVSPKGPALPFDRGLVFPELLLTFCEPPP
jgi:hypothetical protein